MTVVRRLLLAASMLAKIHASEPPYTVDVEGPCTFDTTTSCARSPNFPQAYEIDQVSSSLKTYLYACARTKEQLLHAPSRLVL